MTPLRRDREGGRSPVGVARGREIAASSRSVIRAVVAGVGRGVDRPTASDVAAGLVALVAGWYAGGVLLGTGLASIALVGGLTGALAVVLLASPRPLVRGVGGVVAVPVAVVVATPVTLGWAFAAVTTGLGLFAATALWALTFAGLGAALVSWERAGEGGVRRAATGTLLVAAGIVGAIASLAVPDADVRGRASEALTDVAGTTLGWLVAPAPGGTWSVLTFCGLVGVAAVLVPRTVGSLPLERLVPPDRRDALSDGLDRLDRSCTLAVRIAVGGGTAALAAPRVSSRFESATVTATELRTGLSGPVGEGLGALVVSSTLRRLLLGLAGLAVALWIAERTRRALRRGLAGVLARVLAPAVAGAVVGIALAGLVADPAIDATLAAVAAQLGPASVADLVASLPAAGLAAVVLALALGVLASALFSVSWLRTFRLLPPRAIPAALAACSVFALAVALAVVGRVEPAIWSAAGAFVVWDLGEYADGIRRELGRDAATLRAEVVHAGGAVLSGLAVAGGAIACYRWVATDLAVDPRLAVVGLAAGVLAVVVVAWTLRG